MVASYPAGRIGRNHQRRNGRSKWSRTGCLTPRYCSISCSTFGGHRRASKWQGPARCVAGWNAFSLQPRPLRSWAGANASGPRPSFCRLSSSLPARSPIAPRRSSSPSQENSAVACDGRAQAAVRHLLFIGPRVDLHRLSGRRRTVRPGQRAAEAPPGRGGRWRLFLPGAGRSDSRWPSTVSRQPAGPVLSQNGRDISAIRVAELSSQGVEADAGLLDSYVGSYHLGFGRVLTITREGERLSAQETGRPKFEIVARGVDAFASSHDDLVVFLRDGQAKVTQVLLHEPVYGTRLAPRVGMPPGRRRSRKTLRAGSQRRRIDSGNRPRGRAARRLILQGIDDMQRGAPNYERMSAALAAKIRRQASELQATFKAFGAVESIFFRGVGPGGYDYLRREIRQWRRGIAHPAGSGRQGRRCHLPAGWQQQARRHRRLFGGREPSEPRPRPRRCRVLIYNGSGSDLQLFKLDAEGKRAAFGTIGEEMSFPVTTHVDSPWVIADGAGKCLEIVLPGQQTRLSHGRGRRPARRRSAAAHRSAGRQRRDAAPIYRGRGPRRAGLRSHDVRSRGADTPAASLQPGHPLQARRPARRCRSGASTGLGSDIYIAQFANGSAEWRIGLVKDGTIGRIALGPQY